MSGNKGIKKKELHSQASGIEELIAALPLCSRWCSRQPANLTPHNVSAELPAVTLICDLQRCGGVKWCLPHVLWNLLQQINQCRKRSTTCIPYGWTELVQIWSSYSVGLFGCLVFSSWGFVVCFLGVVWFGLGWFFPGPLSESGFCWKNWRNHQPWLSNTIYQHWLSIVPPQLLLLLYTAGRHFLIPLEPMETPQERCAPWCP